MAPRDLLATFLALFDDSTLLQQLDKHFSKVRKLLKSGRTSDSVSEGIDSGSGEVEASLQRKIKEWVSSNHSNDQLRIMLWVRMREAYELPALTFATRRAGSTAADDLVASALRSLQPNLLKKAKQAIWGRMGWTAEQEIPGDLDTLVRQTMNDLLKHILENDDPSSAHVRDQLIADVKRSVSSLDQTTLDELLREINSSQLNDAAIRKVLLTSGGLGLFGGSVKLAGFSAYILAAKASAFIPLLSGPAVVSIVAVLANPITLIAATTGVGLFAYRGAERKIQEAIGLQIIAFLALGGMESDDSGLQRMSGSFSALPSLHDVSVFSGKVLRSYQADWQIIAPVQPGRPLPDNVATSAQRVVLGTDSFDRWRKVLKGDEHVKSDTAVLGALTVGELAYHVYALDPHVLRAAEFSRLEDLSDPVKFACFARYVDGMSASSHLGAFSHLKGYAAEQVVAAQLIDQGHIVEFPAVSNEPGWDIAVDGVKFQVKNAGDLSLLHRHFDQFDYPVLANAEVAEMLQAARERGNAPDWADQVHFVEGYSQEIVDHLTSRTLAAGRDILDPDVPVFAVGLQAIRQYNRFSHGRISASQAVQEVLLNGSIVAGLAVVGNYAGITIGLLAFGPAGALVFGSALPVLSRTQLGRTRAGLDRLMRGKQYKSWQTEAHSAFDALVEKLNSALTAKRELLKQRRPNHAPDSMMEYLDWRAGEDLGFIEEMRRRLLHLHKEKASAMDDLAPDFMQWLIISTLHPVVYQRELTVWLDVMGERPGLTDYLADAAKDTAAAAAEMNKRAKDMISKYRKS